MNLQNKALHELETDQSQENLPSFGFGGCGDPVAKPQTSSRRIAKDVGGMADSGFSPTFGKVEGRKKVLGKVETFLKKSDKTQLKKKILEDIDTFCKKAAAPDIKMSVKAVITKNGKVLILKDAYSDFWDLPGGHICNGESQTDALKREVKEETGLDIDNIQERCTFEMKLGKETKPVSFYDATCNGEAKLSEEHTDFKWINRSEADKFNLGKFLSIVQDDTNKKDIDTFLKGYEKMALLSKDMTGDELQSLVSISSQINKSMDFGIKLDGEDRLSQVIYCDSVAHRLHQDKYPDGTSRFVKLDELAELSKSCGEEERTDRLIFLQSPWEAQQKLESLAGVEVLQKGISLEGSKKFWSLLEKAIKLGVEKLTNEEAVMLREWIFAKI